LVVVVFGPGLVVAGAGFFVVVVAGPGLVVVVGAGLVALL
jgi:hypothetical protein